MVLGHRHEITMNMGNYNAESKQLAENNVLCLDGLQV